MSFRAPPKPTDERARATEDLIRERGTDTSRWARMESLATQWDARAAMAAEWIPGGSRVLDVGAGAMALEAALKAGCAYQPADVVERRPGCFVVDLNRNEFPPGRYDWITFLGVLEYVHDVDRALTRARDAAPRMIVTYCTFNQGDVGVRRGMGWVNELTAPQFEQALARTGWKIERGREVKRGPGNIQIMYECSQAA
jgi:methyltransferase family protein